MRRFAMGSGVPQSAVSHGAGVATLLTLLALIASGCAATRPAESANADVEATSLLGRPLPIMPVAEEVRAQREEELAEARSRHEANPTDIDAIIWLGRRTAYLNRYRDAIAIFTEGLRIHPEEPRLLRHRGHRYISVRELDQAIADLARAAALVEDRPDRVEPDGLPNVRGMPTGTLKTSIWYHLGLAQYIAHDFPASASSYARCLAFSENDDMRVAASYWLYLALRRSDQSAEAARVLAAISRDMDVIENHSYHRLLLLFKGEMSVAEVLQASGTGVSGAAVDDATLSYGLGVWHLINGRTEAALAQFSRTIEGPAWAAFGYIAAEAELVGR